MSELTHGRSSRSTRGLAAAVAVLGLALAGVVVEGRIADRGGVVPVEAPARLGGADQAPNSGAVDGQAGDKLTDLKAQRDADAACAPRSNAQRAC